MDIRKQNRPLKNEVNKKKKNVRFLFITLLAIFGVVTFLFVQYIFEDLPSLEELENPQTQLASNVWSRDGELIGSFFIQNRVPVSIDSLPAHVINALIATEDKRFYKHWGVDLQRFFKAMVKNVIFFKFEGASTITQQLARNLYYLKARRETKIGTAVRKLREWVLAIQIEKTYTKREILEMYFNTSPFGKGSFGINMAARIYFNKSVSQLSVQEGAVLVALLKASSRYDPYDKYDNAFKRRNLVMQNMVEEDFLSEEEFEKLKLEPIRLSFRKFTEGVNSTLAPHFLEYIRQQMSKLSDKYGFDLYRDGLNIYTTLDSRMQIIANNACKIHLDEFQKRFDANWRWDNYKSVLNEVIDRGIKNSYNYKAARTTDEKKKVYNRLLRNKEFVDSVKNEEKKIEVGFVALDTKTGEIRAMVGGREQSQLSGRGLNHVTQIKRQPGSAFKPIVYTAAIDNGLYPAFPILNKRFNYNGWSPENFDRSTSEWTTLRWGLAESLNLVAGRLIIEGYAPLDKIGMFAQRMGIKTRLDLYPSISLGTSVVTPLELTSAYATLGNRGVANEPLSILRIEDKDGIVLEQFHSISSEAVPEETAYIVTDMMRSVIEYGTGSRVRRVYNFKRPAAGKTGTNQDYADALFLGFTPQLTAGVWVGFDDQRIRFTGAYGQGADAALPIWGIFMRDVYDQINFPVEDFVRPPSGKVVAVTFCKESIYRYGSPRLYSSDCNDGSVTDIINEKDIPKPYDPLDEYERINPFPFTDSVSREAKEIRPRKN